MGGFTYVELGLVLAIIALAAMAIVPNLVRIGRQREVRAFKARLVAMIGTARSQALESGETVAVTYSKADRSFRAILERSSDSTTTQLREVKVPDGIDVQRFGADRYEAPADGWRVPFFYDGSSSGGGVELQAEGQPWSVLVTTGDARVRTFDDELPDPSGEKWKAGTYVKR